MAERPASEHESSPVPAVEFCGSMCWKSGGERTAAAIAERAGIPLELLVLGERVVAVDERCAAVIRKLRACIGACGRNPAARVVRPGADAEYFSAKSEATVADAIQQSLTKTD